LFKLVRINDYRCPGIFQNIPDGGEGVFLTEWHGYASGPPDPPLDTGIGKPGRNQESYPGFMEVFYAIEQ
jgi:hypothetical protein